MLRDGRAASADPDRRRLRHAERDLGERRDLCREGSSAVALTDPPHQGVAGEQRPALGQIDEADQSDAEHFRKRAALRRHQLPNR